MKATLTHLIALLLAPLAMLRADDLTAMKKLADDYKMKFCRP